MPRSALDMVGYYNESIRGWLDLDYRLRLARVYKFGYVSVPGSAYTLQPAGLTRSLTSQTLLTNWRKVLEMHLDQLDRYDEDCRARVAGRLDRQDWILRQTMSLTGNERSKAVRFRKLISLLVRCPQYFYEYPFLIAAHFGPVIQKRIIRYRDYIRGHSEALGVRRC